MIALFRQRDFMLLWLGGSISSIGDWLMRIGLSVYVYTLTGSALATSITLITGFIPVLLFSSLAGVLVDRWDRRRILIVCNFLLALGELPLLFVHDTSTIWIIYVVQFYQAFIVQFVMPTNGALLPRVVDEKQLVSANALQSLGNNSARLIGGALGGLLVGWLGFHASVLCDIASFLFAGIMALLLHVPSQPGSEPKVEPITLLLQNIGREWLEGMQLILRNPALMLLLGMIAIQGLGEGVFGVLLIVFVNQVLGGDALLYGSLGSLQAVGSLIGGVILGQFGQRFAPARLLGIGVTLFGLIDLLIIDIPLFLPGPWIVMALFVLVGIPGTASLVAYMSLFQTLTSDNLRGRVLGTMGMIQAFMMLIGMVLAGSFGDYLGPVLMLNIQGSAYTFSGLLALLFLGRLIVKKVSPESLTEKEEACV